MTYLFTQYIIFVALALVLGLFVGWATCSGTRDRGGGWLGVALIAFAIGVAAAIAKVVPGLLGHALEVALLLFAAYIIGCACGCALHAWARGTREETDQPTPTTAAFTHEDLLGKPSAESYPGVRPPALATPRGGRGDDLTAIAGLGGLTAKFLNDVGVFHFGQIAAWTPDNVTWFEHHIGQPGRVGRENWIGQAAALAGLAPASAVAPVSAAPQTVAAETQAAAPTPTPAPAAPEAGAPAAPARMMTDGARSLLAQQKKAAARSAAQAAISAPPVAETTAPAPAPENAPRSAPPRGPQAPIRAPMTDGARTIALLKRKEEERAARRAAAAAAPASTDEGRPASDDGTDAAADDLKRIKGIGPKNEGALNALGVRRFSQIAAWTPENARWVGEHMSFPGRIERERWVEQARLLASGVETAHSAAVRSGAVAVDDAPMTEAEAKNFADGLPQPAARVEDEDRYEGARPLGLAAPREGKGDALVLIKGIGPQNEARLHALGVWHFQQIAAWTPENVKWVGSYLAFPGRIDRENWVGQAAILAKGETTAFAERVEKGEVKTSKLI
ncbi:MAG: cell envelope biogenesis protein TolA [Hyphomicrobiales bacterium]|nr:cell envelope biogenesis protein TolA [Hyphomicrobiales bacterium]